MGNIVITGSMIGSNTVAVQVQSSVLTMPLINIQIDPVSQIMTTTSAKN